MTPVHAEAVKNIKNAAANNISRTKLHPLSLTLGKTTFTFLRVCLKTERFLDKIL
jgi:hypothetical protein